MARSKRDRVFRRVPTKRNRSLRESHRREPPASGPIRQLIEVPRGEVNRYEKSRFTSRLTLIRGGLQVNQSGCISGRLAPKLMNWRPRGSKRNAPIGEMKAPFRLSIGAPAQVLEHARLDVFLIPPPCTPSCFTTRPPSIAKLRRRPEYLHSCHRFLPISSKPQHHFISRALGPGAKKHKPDPSEVMMLLPSALFCESHSNSSKPSRPRLVTFAPYKPPESSQSTQTALQTSCRALQAILGSNLNAPPQPLQRQPNPLHIPLQQRTQNRKVLKGTLSRPQPTRGANKRRRDDCEHDSDGSMTTDCEKENLQPEYSTPKRQRRAPLSIPLGLSAADFDLLERPRDLNLDLDMPDVECPDDDDEQGWTADDDRMLVETVLEKMNLSKREWNDCARILGKRRASLGTRWKVLIGEGNVGLRRGRRIQRTELDIRSW